MNAIFERRSIRKYTDDKLTNEQIKQIIKAGMAAACCKASNEWIFIVMTDKQQFIKIKECHEYATALDTAAAAILVCADLEKELAPGEGWWIQDCSASIQNMLVEAADLGIGSLWMGIYPREERVDFVRELCKLPENVMPLGLVSLGIAEKPRRPIDRFVEEQVFDGKYGEIWRV